MIGVSRFQFIQWIAPLVSEAPEGISAYLWARDPGRASIALMNLVSSNINQWTLLAALLPMVLSASTKHLTPIPLDDAQSRDLLLTLSQALLGATLLLNMQLAWWEATGLFVLFVVQLADVGGSVRVYITWLYFAWAALELARLVIGHRKPVALHHFRRIMRGGGD
jgi:cation:H+ antiporter